MTDFENERIRVLHALELLDTDEEERFDRVTTFAAAWFDVPISLISLVDRDRQWFMSHHGLDLRETDRAVSFCAHAIRGAETFEIRDTWADDRFADNALVTGPPHIRFYAGHPIEDVDGWRLGTINIIDTRPRELTPADRKLLEALARWVEAEISLTETRALRDAIARADEDRTRFLARVAHELRTPLNSVYGYSQLLEMHAIEPENVGPVVAQMTDACERLIELIDQLLDVTFLDPAGGADTLVPVAVGPVVRDVLDRHRDVAGRRNITLVEHDLDELHVRADRSRLLQVLDVLVDNAVRYNRSGGTVTIQGRPSGSHQLIQVVDTGCGIPPGDLARVFEPFDRLERSAPGTGLGLTVARAFTEWMRGTLTATSDPGEGSTFTLVLRAAEAPAEPGPRGAARAVARPPWRADGRG